MKRGLLLGACGALAILTRPTFLPFFAAASVWLVWRGSRSRRTASSVVPAAALLAGFALAALPVGLLFQRETGRFTILPQSGGINLFIGNNPESPETLVIRPGWKWNRLTRLPRREGIVDPWEAQAYFLGRVRHYLVEDPAGFAEGLGRKSLQFISSREIPRNVDPYLFSRWSVVLSLLNPKAGGFGFPFGLLLPLALIGGIARRREIPGPVWLGLLLYPAALIAVFVSGRYRAPLLPLMAVLAAAGAGFLVQAVRRKEWGVLGLSALLAILTVSMSSLPGPFREERPNYEAEMYYSLGTLYSGSEEAASCFRKAVDLDPEHADAHVSLAHVHLLRGDTAEAEAFLNRAIRIAPENPNAINNRGTIYLRRGEYDRAIGDFDEAIRLDPTFGWAYAGRGFAYLQRADYDRAIHDLTEAIELDPENAEAYNHRGLAGLARGDHDNAIRDFRAAVDRNPRFEEARENLRIALARQAEERR